MKWNKKIKAQMWASMIRSYIEKKKERELVNHIGRVSVAIGGIFLLCVGSLYFAFGL